MVSESTGGNSVRVMVRGRRLLRMPRIAAQEVKKTKQPGAHFIGLVIGDVLFELLAVDGFELIFGLLGKVGHKDSIP